MSKHTETRCAEVLLCRTLAGLWMVITFCCGLNAAELKVTFFDVGQGESALIEFPDGKTTALIDAGIDFSEAGAIAKIKGQPISPYLKNAGVKKINIVLITHPDPEHIGGMIEILKEFRAGVIYGYTPPGKYDEATGTYYSKYEKINFNPPPVGKKFKYGGAVLEILSPSSPFLDTGADENNNSVVAKLTYGDFSVLFTGDIEWAGEFALVDMPEKVKSTILKLSNHGSYTSSSSAFLDRVNPEVAIISCGAGNYYGYPHAEVIQRLADHKIKVHRTDDEGTITVISDGKTYTITTEF